jgi:hypothetical protein
MKNVLDLYSTQLNHGNHTKPAFAYIPPTHGLRNPMNLTIFVGCASFNTVWSSLFCAVTMSTGDSAYPISKHHCSDFGHPCREIVKLCCNARILCGTITKLLNNIVLFVHAFLQLLK